MPTNQRTNSSRTRVEEPSRRSREFHVEQDGLTLEVVHAAELLKNYFEGLGCEDWIFMGVCSRKLLERVNERRPNPGYVTMPDLGRWTGGPEPVPSFHETANEHHFVYPNGTRVTARTVEEVQRIRRIVDGDMISGDMMMRQQHVVDPHPYEQIMAGPPPNGLMPPELTPEEAYQRWQRIMNEPEQAHAEFRIPNTHQSNAQYEQLMRAAVTESGYPDQQYAYPPADNFSTRPMTQAEHAEQMRRMYYGEELDEMNHQALVNQTITELGPVTGSQPAPEDTPF